MPVESRVAFHCVDDERVVLKILTGLLNYFVLIAAWVSLAFIVYATLSPIGRRPTIAASTIFEHVGALLVLGALFCVAYPRHPLFAGLMVLGSAALLEFGQLLTPDRHARWEDLVEKLAGACIGLLIGSLVNWVRTRRSDSRYRG